MERRVLLGIGDVHCQRTADLIQAALAHRRPTGGLGTREGRQQQGDENRDSGDNNQQFKKRKGSAAPASATCMWS
jgi:hypothetical protein